jgi:hypothetical protein
MTQANNKYMNDLKKCLIDNRKIAESTAQYYVRTLYNLNNKKLYNNLNWAKNKDAVQTVIDGYAKNTQYSCYAVLTSALSTCNTKPTYKAIYNYWRGKMNTAKEERKQEPKDHEKTETQTKNWLTMEEIIKKRDELADKVNKLMKNKTLTEAEFELLQRYLLICIYTMQPPRRNEYLYMEVIPKPELRLPTDKNYYIISSHQFVFNKYKTQKTMGQQIIPVPDDLANVINMYLKFHPLRDQVKYPLLVKYDGSPITALNFITRALHKVLRVKIGSSMLRHIYLTEKQGPALKSMMKDAEAMAHSVNTAQNEYIKL